MIKAILVFMIFSFFEVLLSLLSVAVISLFEQTQIGQISVNWIRDHIQKAR